jgi:hypothetical protein
LAATEEYNDNLHEELHVLYNQLHPIPPHAVDDEMGSVVIMADDGDDIEVDGPEDVPPKDEEDEELEPASDEDGGKIFDTNSEDDE